jgi:hypothetical protein
MFSISRVSLLVMFCICGAHNSAFATTVHLDREHPDFKGGHGYKGQVGYLEIHTPGAGNQGEISQLVHEAQQLIEQPR